MSTKLPLSKEQLDEWRGARSITLAVSKLFAQAVLACDLAEENEKLSAAYEQVHEELVHERNRERARAERLREALEGVRDSTPPFSGGRFVAERFLAADDAERKESNMEQAVMQNCAHPCFCRAQHGMDCTDANDSVELRADTVEVPRETLERWHRTLHIWGHYKQVTETAAEIDALLQSPD